MTYHHDAVFGAGLRAPLGIGDRALWLARLHSACRDHRITLHFREVGRALLKRLGADGRLDPCYATLARDTGFSARTVGRAVRALADAGLLTWTRRLVRTPGWRCAQTSNAYALVVPGARLPSAPPRVHKERGSKASLSIAAEDAAAFERAARQIAMLVGLPPGTPVGFPASYPGSNQQRGKP